jgi:hypothetical protein
MRHRNRRLNDVTNNLPHGNSDQGRQTATVREIRAADAVEFR